MAVAALSQHPEAADATAEVVGQVLDHGLDSIDLAVLFTSVEHRDAIGDIASTVRSLLQPGRLIGVTSAGILGGAREVEDGPAISLWAASLGGVPDAVRLTAASTPTGTAVQGLPHVDEPDTTLVLLADPFSLPVPDVLDVLAAGDTPLAVIGGLAAAAMSPGGNRLVLDDEVFSDGAVGVVLDGDWGQAVVSQGCRPVGEPMIVTEASGTNVMALAGKPALTRLEEIAADSSPEERALLAGGVHIGVVVDEHKSQFTKGDFLVRSVLGADRESRSLAVGTVVEVGTTVQFHLRDADTADADLRDVLAGHRAKGALVFTCNGRGRNMFEEPDHDAALVADVTTTAAVAGMFCAGEIGPVGNRSFLHGFTACVLLVN